MSAIKIQLNSLEALERLIGGDSELEFELRNKIVQDFSRRHLKSLVNAAGEDMQRAVYGIFDTYIKEHAQSLHKGWNGRYQIELKDDVKNAIAAEFQTKVNNFIQETANKFFEGEGLESKIQAAIDRKLEAGIKDLVNQKVNEKLQKLKEILN